MINPIITSQITIEDPCWEKKEKKRSNGRSILIKQGLDRENISGKIVAVYKSCPCHR